MDENKETVEDVKVEGTGEVGTQANENKDEGKAEKKYSQADFDALDKKLKTKYEKKYEGIDIAKFKEWEESQKTAEQKQAEKDAEYQKVLTENKTLNNTIAVLEAGVNKKFIKYVSFEVSQQEGDFEENLAKFLSENPEYIQGKELAEAKATGAPVKAIDSTEEDGVLAILRKKYPNIKI